MRITRAKAIRLKCLDCCCGSAYEVTMCDMTDCSLWRYRSGKEERDEMYFQAHRPKQGNEDC